MHTRRQLIAWSFACFSLTGRWSFSRIVDSNYTEGLGVHTVLEPRLWAIVVLFLSTVFFVPFRKNQSSIHAQGQRTVFSTSPRAIFFLLMVLFVYLLLSSAFLLPDSGPLTKAYEMLLIMLYCICTYFIISHPDRDLLLEWIWFYLVLIALFLFVLALPTILRGGMSADEEINRMSVLGGGPNIFVRFVALCLIHSFYRLFHKRNIWFIVLIPMLAAGAVLSGSRGGMLAIVITILVFFYLERLLTLRRILKTVFLTSLLFLFAYWSIFFLNPKLHEHIRDYWGKRVVEQTFEKGSSAGRDEIWRHAYIRGWESPIWGHGLGAWIVYNGGGYPHNIFLELFYEAGFVSVCLFVVILCLTFRIIQTNFIKHSVNVRFVCFLCMFIIASQWSGDFFDSRCVFPFLLLSTVPK